MIGLCHRRRLLVLLVLLLSAIGLHACSRSAEVEGRGPNVLLITMDTVRADHCSALGYRRDTTPNLCVVTEEGASCTIAYSPSASTAPGHATIFTALYPVGHRVLKNGLTLSENHDCLAELFRDRGYQTAAIVSSFVLNRKFGFAQGFETYQDDFDAAESTLSMKSWQDHQLDGAFDRRADHTTSRAIEWLEKEQEPGSPFFLFVHYFDPHSPYDPPEPFASKFAPKKKDPSALRQAIARYDAEIAFMDQEIGRLLETVNRLGLTDRTLVVITSDHGEGLMQHGHMYHGVHIYEEAVRIPLLFRWPGEIPAGRVIEEPVVLADVAPTICELVGIEHRDLPSQGLSLARALRQGRALDPERPVLLYRRPYQGETIGSLWLDGDKFGLRSGSWKYIEGQGSLSPELFDLAEDPKEKNNVCSDFPELAERLAGELENWKVEYTREAPVLDEMTEEDVERLRALGYVR
jgi:arylsulfatase A-like enzyme